LSLYKVDKHTFDKLLEKILKMVLRCEYLMGGWIIRNVITAK